MSRPLSPIVCDGPGCGKQKQEANHWYVIACPASEYAGSTRLKVCVYDYDAKADDLFQQFGIGWKWYDFCGQTCALKFISEQMGKAAVSVQSPGDHQESNSGSQGGQNNAK